MHTLADAKKKNLWPRPSPLSVAFTATPSGIEPGGTAELFVEVFGGIEPYSYTGSHPDFTIAKTVQTTVKVEVSPEQSQIYRVEVADARGQREVKQVEVLVAEPGKKPLPPKKPDPVVVPKIEPPKPVLASKGPLLQAITDLWEKARKSNIAGLETVVIHIYDAPSAWKIHQTLATYKEATVVCRFDVGIESEGISEFQVVYEGTLEKANPIKSFLEPQLRAATDHTFEAKYTLKFAPSIPTTAEKADTFGKAMTRYGSGESYVEATAAAPGGGS